MRVKKTKIINFPLDSLRQNSNTDDIVKCNKNPMTSDCENCDNYTDCYDDWLRKFSKMPFFILKNSLSSVSKSAWIVFCYINACADFNEQSKNYGKCQLTHREISNVTKVSINHISKYIKELGKRNLVDCSLYIRMSKNNNYETIHNYTVCWMKRIKNLNELHNV